MNTKVISVVMPSYNSENYVRGALKSLQEQSFQDFEVIVVDSGSTDNSKQIFKEFEEKDKRFCFIASPGTEVSAARNKGMEMASGKYIFFMDSDDLVPPYALERLLQVMGKEDIDIAVGGILHCKEGKKLPECKHTKEEGKSYEEKEKFRKAACLFEKRVFEFLFKLFRRDFLEQYQIRFDERLSLGEDRIFMLEAFQRARQVCCIEDIVYYHLLHKNSLGYCYRSDMVEIALMLHNTTKKWFQENQVYDAKTERICDSQFLTGVGVMILHEIQTEYREGNRSVKAYRRAVGRILELEEVKELCARKQKGLSLYKWAAWRFMRMGFALPFIVQWKLHFGHEFTEN